MLVKAISKGFYIEIKEKGDVFVVPDDFPLGSWTVKVEVASEKNKEPQINEVPVNNEQPVKKRKKAKVQKF